METRELGRTGMRVSVLGYGASPLGQEFGPVDLQEGLRAVRTALDLGITHIDTSPFYGRGMSEVLLGVALRDVPRDSYTVSTKLGRYDVDKFDFSARRVVESVDVSLHRLGIDHIDLMLCHDIEHVDLTQVIEETLPALRKVQEQGKVRFVGVSGFPLRVFERVLDATGLDAIEWIRSATSLGAGEILLTSMDRDGTKDGYDLQLLEAAREATTVPIIASGGAGEPSDLASALQPGRADAALAASIFHRSEYPIPVVKNLLADAGIPMRIVEVA